VIRLVPISVSGDIQTHHQVLKVFCIRFVSWVIAYLIRSSVLNIFVLLVHPFLSAQP